MSIDVPHSHVQCFACGSAGNGDAGLALRFSRLSTGQVEANIELNKVYQGYQGIVHGGIIATLLDAAMTHRLFAENIEAMTVDLQLRFVKPIPIGALLNIRADIDSCKRGVFTLSSQILCEQAVCASATAKFMKAKSATVGSP